MKSAVILVILRCLRQIAVCIVGDNHRSALARKNSQRMRIRVFSKLMNFFENRIDWVTLVAKVKINGYDT